MLSNILSTKTWLNQDIFPELLNKIHSGFSKFILTAGVKAVFVFITLIVGIILIRLISYAFGRVLEKSRIEVAAKSFIRSMSKAILYTGLAIVI